MRFRDEAGTMWEVYEVPPTNSFGVRVKYLPAGFENGWLVFESDHEKRRLAPIPAGWEDMDRAGIDRLLQDERCMREAKRPGG